MLGTVARVSAILAFSGISITWVPFRSPTYPYKMLQPTSYKHLAIDDTSGRPVDYFFPSLGSLITNVNVFCDRVHTTARADLQSAGAKHIHSDGRILIDGRRRALVEGQFGSSLAGNWTQERAVFTAHGHVWHLTMSYAQQFRSQRPIMIKMLKSFKPM
jgi:hypothetical protein